MGSEKENPFNENLVACPDCDLLQRIPVLTAGGKARCHRCRRILAVDKTMAIERTLALTIAAFIFFVLANLEPLLGLATHGRQTSTTIFGSVLEMWGRGYEITAVLVGFCAILAPAVYISFMLVINFMALRPPAPWWIGILLHWSDRQQTWSMPEVMLLGILISLIKLSDIATMIPGVGMYAAGALIILLASIKISFDPTVIWQRLQWVSNIVPAENAYLQDVASGEVKS
jgi:paraquat-inducible protein A